MKAWNVRYREDRKVDVASSFKLADGQTRGQALTLEEPHLAWFADRLEDFLAGKSDPMLNHAMGIDLIAFVSGGTDYAPMLTIINLGENRGTVWLGIEQGLDLLAAIRHAVATKGAP